MHYFLRARLRAHRPTGPSARRRLPALLVTLSLPLLGALSACGGEGPAAAAAAEVSVSDAWVRSTDAADDKTMSAAFMTIHNDTDDDVRLIGASSPAAGTVQLHEMAMVDGTMSMQQVPRGITIVAGRGQLLRPGGYHVMLMDLKRRLRVGDEVSLTLRFADRSPVEVQAPVKQFTEEEPHYHPSPSSTPRGDSSMDMGGDPGQDGP